MKKEKLHEETLRLLVFVIGIFSICILLLTFKLKVNAESPSGILPYVVPSMSDLNSAIPTDIILNSDSLIRTTYNLSDDDSILYFFQTYDLMRPTLGEYEWNSFSFIVNPSVRGYSESYDYLGSSCTIYFGQGGSIEFKWTGQIRGPYGIGGSGSTMLGSINTNTISQGTWTPYYPFYLSGPDVYSYPLADGGNEPLCLFFTNYVASVPDDFQIGHAVEPSYDSDTIIDSDLHPNIKPSFPTINNYNFTTYVTPSLDTSSLENLVKSVFDAVVYNGQYLATNFTGAINNFQNSVSDLLDYFSDLSSYLVQRILNTMKQTAENTYENFEGLLEPTLNSFANMINIYNTLYNLGLKDGVFDIPTLFGALFVPSSDDLDTIVGGLGEVFVLSDSLDSIKDLFDIIFDTLNDNPVYSVHIPGFYFHGVSVPPMEISFDWYLPYKSTGDIFISAFLIVGYLYWLWCRIAGLFHGVSPDAVGVEDKTVHVVGFGRSLEEK